MKQFINILFFLCIAATTYAQNPTEAKMAYQMAEEKFDAKQYTEALDYLEKAETALGNTNPPMLFLKIMITNQIVSANESMDNYRALEKAITDFDKHKDKNKNALGEDKLMDVYRIKMDLDKRKEDYQSFLNKETFKAKAIDEFFQIFPKVEIDIKDFSLHPYNIGRENYYLIEEDILKYFEINTLLEPFLKQMVSRAQRLPFVSNVRLDDKKQITDYIILVEVTQQNTNYIDVLSAFGLSEEYINAFKPIRGKYFYNIDLEGFELKDVKHKITIDSKIRKSTKKYKRNNDKNYINYLIIYVSLEE